MAASSGERSVTIFSGGLDSTVLVYYLKEAGYEQTLLSFDYGQRHRTELDRAAATAEDLNLEHHVVSLRDLTKLLAPSDSSLVSARPVPHGHYEAESMKSTVVPNRNAIMLSIAWGHAVAIGATVVATAVHAGDHAIYPDCRPEFLAALSAALQEGTEGFARPSLIIHAPFRHSSKANIVEQGHHLGVQFENTWSCYDPQDAPTRRALSASAFIHCGRCGTCVERKEAFRLANVVDPTTYFNADYEIAAFRG